MFNTEPPFQHDQTSRIGVLLINLGTPSEPTPAALRTYLREFLSDQRVVELPRALWWLILNGIILNTRPAKSAAKYASIWQAGGSPLKLHTEQITGLVNQEFSNQTGTPVLVDYAMRYGQPSVASVIAKLKRQGCNRLLILPLYPQYAGSSTATALDSVFHSLLKTRNMPEIRVIRHYHDYPGYIAALKQSVENHWAEHGRSDILMMSFHGVPKRTLELGDPYHCECLKTGRLLAESLGLAPEQYRITFQSRFGKAEWLKPYTSETLEALGRAKTRRLDVICPGFAADCLETLEEIALEGKTSFLNAGGAEFRYIPALNSRPAWIAALTEMIKSHLIGWIDPNFEPTREKNLLTERLQRARALGCPK